MSIRVVMGGLPLGTPFRDPEGELLIVGPLEEDGQRTYYRPGGRLPVDMEVEIALDDLPLGPKVYLSSCQQGSWVCLTGEVQGALEKGADYHSVTLLRGSLHTVRDKPSSCSIRLIPVESEKGTLHFLPPRTLVHVLRIGPKTAP